MSAALASITLCQIGDCSNDCRQEEIFALFNRRFGLTGSVFVWYRFSLIARFEKMSGLTPASTVPIDNETRMKQDVLPWFGFFGVRLHNV